MTLDQPTRTLLKDPTANYAKRRAWVIYQLKTRGLDLAKVARKAGVARQQAWKAMHTSYPKMEGVIAKALGLKPQQLFPERYDRDGLPKGSSSKPAAKRAAGDKSPRKNSSQRTAGNVSGRAANEHRVAA